MRRTIELYKCDGCGEEQNLNKPPMQDNAPGMLLVEINQIRYDVCEKNGCADKIRRLVSANDRERVTK
jgi:hypothetical protein